MALIAVAIVAFVAVIVLTRHGRRPESPLAGVAALGSDVDALSPSQAYQRAFDLTRQTRFEASLPYYRRGLAGPLVRGIGQAHYNYAIALFNSTMETRRHFDRIDRVCRSSDERVERIRTAFAESEVAMELAQDAHELQNVHMLRAQCLQIWGLPWDAVVELDLAIEADSTHHAARAVAEDYLRELADIESAPR